MVVGWGVSAPCSPLVLFTMAACATALSAWLLLSFSDVRRCVSGALLLGGAVGCCARGSAPGHALFRSSSPSPEVGRFELVQPWSPRGSTARWLAVGPDGRQALLEVKGPTLGVGQTMVAGVRRLRPEPAAHLADFDERAFLKGRGVSSKYAVDWHGAVTEAPGLLASVRRALDTAKLRVRLRCLSLNDPDVSGLLMALMTGDKGGVSRTTKAAFSDVGLSHLVAVSGFHIGLMAGLFLLVFQWLGCPAGWRPYLLAPLVWGYVGLCGWPGSAVRAAAMMSVGVLALALGRKSDGMTVLSAVALAIVAFRPEALGDLGVGLSFLATAGILLLHRCFKGLGWSSWLQKCGMLVGVPLVATACTAPLAWPAFGKFPVVFVATNIMAAPLVTAILVLFVAWYILPGPFSWGLREALVHLTHLFLDLVSWWAEYPPLLLPLDRTFTACAGGALAVGCIWGLAVQRPLRLGLAGALTAFALLRWSSFEEQRPRAVMVGSDCVVYARDKVTVFPASPTPRYAGVKTWKTRSLTERVSNEPPDSIWWCGAQWAMSSHHIRYRTQGGQWRVVSSFR